MNITNIDAIDIPDAWFRLLWDLQENGRKFTVEQGSYVGETRLQFDFAVIHISRCYSEPWGNMLPQMPEGPNIPPPVTIEYLYEYIPYLLTPQKKENESYTYGERIDIGIKKVINLLKNTPGTNQACLAIAKPDDILKNDPPCLREVSYQCAEGVLNQFVNFRSWDLWGGFPANLAALAILHKFIADEAGLKLGETIATTKGLHIYGYAEKLAKIRTGK